MPAKGQLRWEHGLNGTLSCPGNCVFGQWTFLKLSFAARNVTEALGQRNQASSGGRIPLWHLPVPILRN
eukprot:1139925-Pelagomonas_calceolata.AAC.3